MSDIFVSYAREDRGRVLPLVQALEKTGWSIFWDTNIRGGTLWRRKISEEIQACQCVLAVWTEKSVNKEWVLNEAEIGKKRGILVPVMLDEVEPPLGFSEIQAAKLEPWNELLDSIGNILGQAPVTPPPPKPSPPPNEIQPIRKSFLDGLISITAKSSSMFKWIVLIVLATYIISVLILREFEKAGVYFKPPAVSQIGFMVLVFVSGLVLTIAKIFNRFKRKQKSGSN